MRHPTLLDRRTVRGPMVDDALAADAAAWLTGGAQEWRWDDDLEREPPHSLPEGMRLRDYEILGQIGEGGSGIVYLAWDGRAQGHVAIKEYLPRALAARDSVSPVVLPRSQAAEADFREGLQSFVDEAQLLARFDHPALVKVLHHWEDNGTAYMAMPYYDGPTLTRALARLGRPPDEAELLAWLAPLLDALSVLHAGGCLHRDVAPDNILLTDDGPVLLDFGAARQAVAVAGDPAAVVFKPGYTPIEQYRESKQEPQGPWTDLYAVAAVVYGAIAGEPPQAADERLREDRFEPLTQRAYGRWRGAFLAAIDAALALAPKGRPQSVDEFRALLADDDSIEQGAAVTARPAAPVQDAPAHAAPIHAAPIVKPPILAAPVVEPPRRFEPVAEREPQLLGPLAAIPAPQAAPSARSLRLRRLAGRRRIHKSVYLGIALVLLAGVVGYERVGDRSTLQGAAQPMGAPQSGPVVQARVAASALASAAASAAAKAIAPTPTPTPPPTTSSAQPTIPTALPTPTTSPPPTPAHSSAQAWARALVPTPTPPPPQAAVAAAQPAEPAPPAQPPVQAAAAAAQSTSAPIPLPPPSAPAAAAAESTVTTVRAGVAAAAPGPRPATDATHAARRDYRRRDADEAPLRAPVVQAGRDPAAPAPANGWCTDMLQRASLQPLTAGEVALLRSECK